MAIKVELYPINIEQGQFELVEVIRVRFNLSEDIRRVSSECSLSSLPSSIIVVSGGVSAEFTKTDTKWAGTISSPLELLNGAAIEGFPEVKVVIRAARADLLTARERLIEDLSATRDSILQTSDYMVVRHRDEMEGGLPTTLTSEQYAELLTYRQALRDFPATVDLDNIVWPTPPSFL